MSHKTAPESHRALDTHIETAVAIWKGRMIQAKNPTSQVRALERKGLKFFKNEIISWKIKKKKSSFRGHLISWKVINFFLKGRRGQGRDAEASWLLSCTIM